MLCLSRLRTTGFARFASVCALIALSGIAGAQEKPKEPKAPIAIGTKAPNFSLLNVDGKKMALADFDSAKVLVLIFTANHCPTAQAYEERIKKLHATYKTKGVAIVAISSNDPKALRLDELGYTDLGDTYEDGQLRARHQKFDFPYLYDGDTQEVARAYGPQTTPHVFVFDAQRALQYVGRIDNNENPAKATEHDLKNAIDALLAGQPVPVATTKAFGCSTKWMSKRDSVQESLKQWAQEPVSLETIDVPGVKAIMKNPTDKLRLVHVWATWCGPCVTEFPHFVDLNRMYRRRGFELIAISADPPDRKDKVHTFLKEHEASFQNYIYSEDDKYKLVEAIDPDWVGAIPYTALVAPDGKIIKSFTGAANQLELKQAIVDYLGRFFFSVPK